MASNLVVEIGEREEAVTPSSRRRMTRSDSTPKSGTCEGGHHVSPRCVCAPATHAGSFKCRLHRTNSAGGGGGGGGQSPGATSAPGGSVIASS